MRQKRHYCRQIGSSGGALWQRGTVWPISCVLLPEGNRAKGFGFGGFACERATVSAHREGSLVKIIDLPIVDFRMGTLQALDQMARSGRTAVLVETQSGHGVLLANTAIEALRRPMSARKLSDIDFTNLVTDATGSVSPRGWRGPNNIEMDVVKSTFKLRGVDQLLVGV